MANTIGVDRPEKRIPMAIAVTFSGHERAPGTETTFTENVSSRGARVTSTRAGAQRNVGNRVPARRLRAKARVRVLPGHKAKALSSDLSS